MKFTYKFQYIIKNVIGIFIALIFFISLFPLFILFATLIKTESKGPVLFKQIRPGLKEKTFILYKFRTMNDLKDEHGNLLPDEKRLTKIGKFLRRLSLDELPELWNVLKGDMSFVGPRPLLVKYLDRYTPEQARRHEVKPGISGWAQVNGRNAITWEEKFKYDVWYVDNWSLWLDFKIIAITILKVLKGEGTIFPDLSTAKEFKGSKNKN